MNRTIRGQHKEFAISWSNRIIYVILVIIFLLVLTGCKLTENQEVRNGEGIENTEFLTDQPCGPPCLWGIYPGLSTQEQVLEVLEEKGIESKCEWFDRAQEGGGRGIICRGLVVFSFQDRIVENIGFIPSEKITVEEYIKHFNTPNFVSVTPSQLPEYPHTMMTLYFDNIQTRINLPEQEGTKYRLEATTEIENIGYFDEKAYKSSVTIYQDWVGYGEYH